MTFENLRLQSIDSIDFLPSALALEQKSPPKLVRLTIYVFIAAVFSLITWATFGKLEVIAPLQGQFIASQQSKLVQSIRLAQIEKILVQEGDFVRKGQILMTLNPDLIENEATKLLLQKQFHDEKLQQKNLVTNSNGNAKILNPSETQSIKEYQALQNKLSAQLLQIDLQIKGVQLQITKLEQTQKFNIDKEHSYEKLLQESFISEHALWEKQQITQETNQEIQIQQNRLKELQQQKKTISFEKQQTEATWNKNQLKEKQEHEEASALTTLDIQRNEREQKDWQIIAPIDGIVQDLQVHGSQAVLQPGQNILTVVPQSTQGLQVEALMENKDVGFVKIGQQARIKIDVFPYTRYGTLMAEVIDISSDVVGSGLKTLNPQRSTVNSNENNNSTNQAQQGQYRVTLKLIPPVNINITKIKPGMQISAEIHTGKRSVLSYFLSPLIETTSESLGER